MLDRLVLAANHDGVPTRSASGCPSQMLESTFIHLPGIGAGTEKRLWAQGITTWDQLESLLRPQLPLFADAAPNLKLDALAASREAFRTGDASYFASRLPFREHYRIAATFPDDTVFLDIETTGLSTYYDQVTLIGLSRGRRYVCRLANDRDNEWRDLLRSAKCLVTFNGTAFDLKFLARDFPDLVKPSAHVDLRFLARRVGLNGGQKSVEQQLGVARAREIEDVRGETAALLWFDYKAGSIESGRRLVRYNHADIEGMKVIFDAAVARLAAKKEAPPQTANTSSFANLRTRIRFAQARTPKTKNLVYVPKFRGRKGPRVNFADLSRIEDISDLRVVGIDLTGSESRPTGWCSLVGRKAETKLERTDDEIIEATCDARPDLVSIDSPLSLPVGRLSALDSDPGRDTYGIMRECERTLKRRGVNVYPCLIPSMQNLTQRGIRLATHFRSLGIPVIESYPGAAQDIMNIPRKRASLDQLKHGLKLFGITGEFIDKPVTHDEVDAVTSAVVGLFFWCGKFEALGNEQEEYLIIPHLHRVPDDWRQRRVVGISGPIAAGKTTAARMIEKEGFAYGRYSEVLAEIARQEGRKPDRDTLQEIGDRVHHVPGQRWLSAQLLKRLPEGADIVIDGLRWPEDHAF